MILPATHQLLTHNYQEMMRLLIAGIIALFYLSETSGECPNMDDIPVMYDKERFTCGCNYAINYTESHIKVFDKFLWFLSCSKKLSNSC